MAKIQTAQDGLYDSRVPTVIAITTIYPILALIAVTARFWTRITILQNVTLEDYLAAFALALSISMSICILFQVKNGMGRHIQSITLHQGTNFHKLFLASIIVYNLGLTFTKLSILMLYRRFCISRPIIHIIYVLVGCVLLYGFWAVLSAIFNCVPAAKFWDDRIPGHCINKQFVWFLNAGIDIATDLTLMALPFVLLKNLRVSRRIKYMLIMKFSILGFAPAASIIRLRYLYVLSVSEDVTWEYAVTAMWSITELNVGIIGASSLQIGKLFERFFGLINSPAAVRRWPVGSEFAHRGLSDIAVTKWSRYNIRAADIRLRLQARFLPEVPGPLWMQPLSNLDLHLQEQFCDFCRTRGIYRRLKGDNSYEDVGPGLNFQPLEDVLERRKCSFCRLVLGLLPQARMPPACSSQSTQHPLIHLRGLPKPYIGYKVYINHERGGDIIRKNLSFNDVCSIDLQWLRSTLNTCQNHHTLCSSSKGHNRGPVVPMEILLVDLQNRCLIEASSTYEYLALSYVRGNVPVFETKQSNLSDLKQPHSLDSFFNKMPSIIQDAMTLVKLLDKRYLWVDTLCIIQDTPDKHLKISQMDVIYNQALLTIVATSANAANSRLPGVCSGARPVGRAAFDIHSSLIASRPLSHIFENSVYETRGWTLQERMLSVRCLHLTDWTAVFQCQELLVAEHSALPNRFYDPDGWQGPCKPLFWPLVSPDGINRTTRACFDTYSRLVEMYTGRNLSYKSDALNAFSGILSAIEHHLGGQSRSGIPVQLLNLALLWVPTYHCRIADQIQTPRRNPRFPSWSWVGWSEQVSFVLSRFVLDGTEEHVESTRWKMSDQASNSFTGPTHQELTNFDEASSSHTNLDSLRVRARIVSAAHFVSHRASLVGLNANENFESYIRPYSDTNRNKCYGKLFGSPIPGDDDPIRPACELIQLFRLEPPTQAYGKIEERDLFGTITQTVESPRLCSYSKTEVDGFGEARITLLFIMLIKWNGSNAERFAVGYIYEDAWEAAHPVRKDVLLT